MPLRSSENIDLRGHSEGTQTHLDMDANAPRHLDMDAKAHMDTNAPRHGWMQMHLDMDGPQNAGQYIVQARVDRLLVSIPRIDLFLSLNDPLQILRESRFRSVRSIDRWIGWWPSL